MESQKTINLLNNKVTQLSQHRTKTWVEINAEARRNCNINSQINFTTIMFSQVFVITVIQTEL